ncbi:MAG: acetylornithine transaminase [Verrucomicrobiales bacterium]|nr:acetylornithine transaminase [Verrucomicrobiales bacterium]
MNTFERTEKYVLGNYGRFPVSFVKGDGAWIWDESGKQYLDFASGIAVCSLGHSPKCMQEVLREQSATLIHCSNLYHIPKQAELAEFIVETAVQLSGKVFFANSGAEANDGAVKLARKYFYDQNGNSDRFEVITCNNSFHGRTLGGIAATGQDKVKTGFDPLLPGFLHVPFNDCEALRAAVLDKTAAILFEPVQGEGGIHVATPEFIQTAVEIREQHGVLLMFDEVQCGFGRTGDWCGFRSIAPNVEPDVITWAKGMAGGFPMGAMWISDKCAGSLGPGTHGSTFGGTPLGSAVALAVLQEIGNTGCLDNVRNLENYIRERVEGWNFPHIQGLRGLGLMLGFILNEDAFGEVSPSPSIYLVNQLMKAGLLTVPAGASVVRWLPPLNTTKEEIDKAFEIMEDVIAEL